MPVILYFHVGAQPFLLLRLSIAKIFQLIQQFNNRSTYFVEIVDVIITVEYITLDVAKLEAAKVNIKCVWDNIKNHLFIYYKFKKNVKPAVSCKSNELYSITKM